MEMEKGIYSRNNPIRFNINIHHSFTTTGISPASVAAIFFILIISLFSSASASSSSSDVLNLPRLSVGRNLLQAVQGCQLDVQSWNYTIITSKCKGPKYNSTVCCNAFRQLACPYAAALNDVSNNCATTMFSYINLYGSYPPGLFANICRDSRRGLECTQAEMSANVSRTTSGSSSSPATIRTTMALFFFVSILLFILPPF